MHALPEVTITNTDRRRLISIATAALASERGRRGASMLLGEIARATVVQPASLPPDVVGMNSEVEVRDNIRETTDRFCIVYPGEEDGGRYKISVLTPTGAALIGLSAGDSIEWCTAARERRSLTVLQVRHRTRNRRSVVPGSQRARRRHSARPARDK